MDIKEECLRRLWLSKDTVGTIIKSLENNDQDYIEHDLKYDIRDLESTIKSVKEAYPNIKDGAK